MEDRFAIRAGQRIAAEVQSVADAKDACRYLLGCGEENGLLTVYDQLRPEDHIFTAEIEEGTFVIRTEGDIMAAYERGAL